jgi:hypothetical protein
MDLNTLPATSFYPMRLFCRLLGLMAFVCLSVPSGYSQVLDLTTIPDPPPQPGVSRRAIVPGVEGGGFGGVQPSHPILPLELEVWRVHPNPIHLGHEITVDLLVRNTGTSPIKIPGSRVHFESEEPEAPNGRIMTFCLDFNLPSPQGRTYSICGSSIGWLGKPASMVAIPPKGTLLVRFDGWIDLPPEYREGPSPLGAEAHPAVEEFSLGDTRLVMRPISSRLVSKSEVHIDINR